MSQQTASPVTLANNVSYRLDSLRQGLIITDYSNKAQVHKVTRLGILKMQELANIVGKRHIPTDSLTTTSKHGTITVRLDGHCFRVEAQPRNATVQKMELLLIGETINEMARLVNRLCNENDVADFQNVAMVA
jgi:hypothetical protein